MFAMTGRTNFEYNDIEYIRSIIESGSYNQYNTIKHGKFVLLDGYVTLHACVWRAVIRKFASSLPNNTVFQSHEFYVLDL